MTEKLKETIKEEIAKLPKEMQEAINAIEWLSIAEQIGKKYILSENKVIDFQTETMLVLIGLETLDLYEVNIGNEIGTTKDQAEKMAEEAYEKIFTPIGTLMEENIKKNLANKKISWQQTVDFILSGGNYFAFLAPTPDTKNLDAEEKNPNTLLGNRSMQDMKDRLIN